ncbi:MAG TPA: GNAT family N-acetyltransferase [Pilimelia sp.]|nr:GNAT family N-acetyltransferase [Pilimelia sp.]
MTDGEPTIRAATPDDWPAVAALLRRAYHGPEDPEYAELDRAVYEPARGLVVADAGEVVGHAVALTRDLTVPGAVVPAAHVTNVAVAPTHRRRGLLSRLMRRQLQELHDAGREPFAVLWASEGRIYWRYGYGSAAPRHSLTIDLREVQLHPDWQRPGGAAGRLRAGDPVDLRKDMAAVYERLRPDRPGWSSRSDAWWRFILADTIPGRDGFGARRAAVVDGEDGPRGYAVWRTRRGWVRNGPGGEVQINAVLAVDPAAYAALWGLLLGIDLAATAAFWFGAVDEPLQYLVPEPSRLGAVALDSLWVRPVDVPAMLAARRYARDVDVVIDVTDPLLPANTGRWRLTGGPAGATCERTAAPADLACGVAELGAVYLGGPSLAALAAAGRVGELRPGALRPASDAFGWHRPPSSIEIF